MAATQIRRELFTLLERIFLGWSRIDALNENHKSCRAQAPWLSPQRVYCSGLRRLLTELTERTRMQCATLEAEQSFQRVPQGRAERPEGVSIHRHSTSQPLWACRGEQYVFARQGRDNTVESFYWIQFEHYLPTNDRTYNYRSKNTTQIGELQFVYNLGSWPDYAAEMAGILPRMVQPLSVCLRNTPIVPAQGCARAYVSFTVSRPPKRVNDHLRRSFVAK
jgi:hypothetical protein